MTYPPFEIVTAPVPQSHDEPPSWHLEGLARIDRANLLAAIGHDDLAATPRELATSLASQKHTIKNRVVAVDPSLGEVPEAVLAGAWVDFPTNENTHSAFVEVIVHPDHRRRGIATALWARAQELVAEQGRSTIMTATSQDGEPAADAPNALAAPTGSGRVDADSPGVIFARKTGFTLAQVERQSTQPVPVDDAVLAQFADGAREAAGGDYDLVRWQGEVPEEWLDEAAKLHMAMSQDIPKGELDLRDEVWDAERIRYREDQLRKRNTEILATAVRHIPSGELAGYTEFNLPSDRPEVAFQENTLVLKAHRGHKLGMWLKAANLQWLQEAYPQVRRIHTWNAEENSYMLDINVALGYRVASVWGEWQQVLPR